MTSRAACVLKVRIVGNAKDEGVIDDLWMVPQQGWDHAIPMTDFFLRKKTFSLAMSNVKEIQAMMCRGSTDCFASSRAGFSTKDVDRDFLDSNCAASASAAWWYGGCYYHQTTGKSGVISQLEYGGCQGSGHSDCGTQYWSWFVK